MKKLLFSFWVMLLGLFVFSIPGTSNAQNYTNTNLQLEAERAQLQQMNLPSGVFNGDYGIEGTADAACDNALPITSGNMVNEPLVCGTVNLLNSTSVGTFCNDDGPTGGTVPTYYGDGLEATYTYTPGSTGTATLTVANTSWTAIFVYDGCPTDGGSCVTATRSTGTTRTVTWNAVEGTEYFIWIDSWPSPASPCVEGGTMTFNGPEPTGGGGPGGGDCEFGIPSFSDIPDAYNIEMSNSYRTADDFIIDAGTTFSMNKITIDTNQQGIPNNATIYIREDNGGQPGNIIETLTFGSPDESEIVGSAFGDPIHHMTYNLATAIVLGEGTYWLDPKMSTASSETVWLAVTDEASYGSVAYRSIDDGASWEADPSGYNVIFTVSGDCDGGSTGGGPCDDKIVAECGVQYTATLNPSSGEWVNYTGVSYSYTGSEQVFEFTAAEDGNYLFEVSQGTADADFMVMDACSNTAANVLGSGYWTGLVNETLAMTAGQTIFIVADLYSGAGGSTTVSLKVTCPTTPPPGGDCEFGIPSFSDIPDAYNIEMSNQYRTADDFIIEAGTTFSMNKITIDTNQQGIPNNATIYIREDNGGQPGNILETLTFGSPDESEVVGSAFGDPIYHMTYNLATAIVLGEGTYWLDPKMSTASSETVWLAVTDEASYGSVAYRSIDDGASWEADPSGYNVIFTVSGDCDGGNTGGDCEQDFYTTEEPNSGAGYSGGNWVANDVVIAGGTQFMMQNMIFETVVLGGEPTTFDLEIFNDNGSGGVGTSTGMTYHFDSSNMTFVPNGLLFGAYPQFTVTFDLPDIVLEANGSTDTRYWLAVSSDLSTTGDYAYWVSYLHSATPDPNSNPTWQFLATDGVWAQYDSSGPNEGYMKVVGECETLGVSNVETYDFAYYPNPVKDVLNINSQKAVKSVEVFNMTGQKVMSTASLTNGQVYMNALNPGVYIFKVMLEGNKVETFKIIKK